MVIISKFSHVHPNFWLEVPPEEHWGISNIRAVIGTRELQILHKSFCINNIMQKIFTLHGPAWEKTIKSHILPLHSSFISHKISSQWRQSSPAGMQAGKTRLSRQSQNRTKSFKMAASVLKIIIVDLQLKGWGTGPAGQYPGLKSLWLFHWQLLNKLIKLDVIFLDNNNNITIK